MKVEVTYLDEYEVLFFKFEGKWPTDLKEMDELMRFQYEQKTKYNTNYFIIDCLKATYKQSVANMLSTPERLRDHDIDDCVKAVIFKKGSESHHNYSLALAELHTQVFLGNSKAVTKIFSDFDTALKWIRRHQIESQY